MITVREIITEACARANIVPRRQAVPGSMMETGYKLLKSITARYNADNLLAFTQDEYTRVVEHQIVHVYDNEENILPNYIVLVETVGSLPPPSEDIFNKSLIYMSLEDNKPVYHQVIKINEDEYVWRHTESPYLAGLSDYDIQKVDAYISMDHVILPCVQKIQGVYMEGNGSAMIKLQYVPYEELSKYWNNELVWGYVEKAEGEFIIVIKPTVGNRKFKFVFNHGLKFDIDSDLHIPDNYTELLICGLTYRLALQYPRLDNAQMERLAIDLKAAQDNVKTPKSEQRMVMREDSHNYGLDYTSLVNGNFLWG